MGKATAKVLVVGLIIAYCAFFIQWNDQPTWIRGIRGFGESYGYTLPLGWWFLITMGIGAVVMAIVTWTEWATQKSRADVAVAQVAKAKTKLQELADTVKQQRQEITTLKAQTPPPPKPEEAEEVQ